MSVVLSVAQREPVRVGRVIRGHRRGWGCGGSGPTPPLLVPPLGGVGVWPGRTG